MLNKDLLKELKISIADIVISIESEQANLRFQNNDLHEFFLTRAPSEVNLRAHYGPTPKCHTGEKVFDTAATWSLFRSNGKWILKAPSKTLILNSDFKTGDIYIHRRQAKINKYYPLDHPLDELLMINLLSLKRGLLVHACGLSYRGKGILFAGSSGAGKSTLANLYKGKRRAVLLSDDRIIIRKINGNFCIYGTPWHGNVRMCSPEKAPLEKIFFLKHAKKNTIKKIAPIEAASRLTICSFPTFWDKKGMKSTLSLCSELAQKIPCYELGFVPDESVLEFVKKIV